MTRRLDFTRNNKTTMNIEQELTEAVKTALQTLYGQEAPAGQIQLQKTKKEFQGHFTLVVFPLLRLSHKKAEDTAREIGTYLSENTGLVAGYNVISGFLNLTVAPAEWISLLSQIDADPRYGITDPTEKSPLVMVEYSSPNTNKPLHL